MKRWKLIVGVALIFFSGVLVGSVGTRVYHRQWSERFWKHPSERKAVFLQKLTKELRLTEEQQKEFEVIIEEVDRKVASLIRDRRAAVREVLDGGFSRMKEKLNPDQQKKLEEWRAKREARMKERKRKPPLR